MRRMEMNSKIMAVECFLLLVFLFLLTTAIQTRQVNAAYTGSIAVTFTCGDGFPGNCFREGCMTEKALKMENNQYTLKFNAPKAAAYKCTITAVTNDFGFKCGYPPYNPSAAEPNEKTQISLNDKVLGTTDDSYCNSVSECVHPPCINDVPEDVGGLSNPECFNGYSDSKFCKKGSVEIKIGDLIQDELNDAKAGEGDDVRYVIFVMSNTRNRNNAGAAFVYFPDINDYVIKTGVGTCKSCKCCACSEGAIKDGWCSEGIFRSESPTLEGNKKYKITWNSNTHTICIKKEGDYERCLELKMPLNFEFNSYCLGSDCQDNAQWHNVWAQKFTNAAVTLESFSCEEDVYTASQSCPGFSNGVVYNGNCGDGGGSCKALGAICQSHTECCSNYCYLNICKREPTEPQCQDDSDCAADERCVNGNCRLKRS